MRCFGHVKRKGGHRIPEGLIKMISEKRPRSRPRTRWIDQFKRDVERGGSNRKTVGEMHE
jgi:hypothetical protein